LVCQAGVTFSASQRLGKRTYVPAMMKSFADTCLEQCNPLSLRRTTWSLQQWTTRLPVSMCELDSPHTAWSSPQHLATVDNTGMNTFVHSRPLVCPAAQHSAHNRPLGNSATVDMPQRARSSHTQCRKPGNLVTVDSIVHTAAEHYVRASTLDRSVTAGHHLTTRPHVALGR
jgi:hypothetical protein